MRNLRCVALAALIAGGGLVAGIPTPASADTGWTMTNTTTTPDDPWFRPIESGPSDPVGCDINGTSSKAFSTGSAVETGPFAGMRMAFSGTMTLGPQTNVGNPSYGFTANYGTLTNLTGMFSIAPYGVNQTPVVTGTFDGLAPSLGSTGTNIGSCYGVGAGSNFGYANIAYGVLIAVNSNVRYTATYNGETITGEVILRQRQINSNLGISYTGPDSSFHGISQPPTPVDVTPPTITINVPTDGGTFTQGDNVTPDFSCADEAGGSGLATCVGSVATLDTSTAGTKTFTVNATDNAGNPATKTVTYTVEAPTPPPVVYQVAGFFQPIDMTAVNSAKAGQTIPAKWRLTDASGALVSDPASFVSATSSGVSCATNLPADVIEEYTTGGSGLLYNADGTWQFNWKTPKSYAGTCRVFSVKLADGSQITAKFQFK